MRFLKLNSSIFLPFTILETPSKTAVSRPPHRSQLTRHPDSLQDRALSNYGQLG